MLIGTTDFYHSVTLAAGHKVSAKRSLLASSSYILFKWSRWNLMWCWSNSSWTPWHYCWVRFTQTREITAGLLTAWKKNPCFAFEQLWTDFVEIYYDDRYYWTLHFDTSLRVLDLHSRSQKCQKARTSASIISQCFQLNRMNFLCCWYLLAYIHFILSDPYSRERTLLMWLCLKNKPL